MSSSIYRNSPPAAPPSNLRFAPGVIPPPGRTRTFSRFRGADNRAAGVPQTLDPEELSCAAIATTENETLIYDYAINEVVVEVLVAAGGIFPAQLPLLDNHTRSSVQHQLGTARDFQLDGFRWLCRCWLTKGVPESKSAFAKIAAGHLTDVSIGYFVKRAVTLMPRESRKIDGRTWTAGDTPLRIATRWEVIELSLTSIGADQSAKIRHHEQAIRDSKPRHYFR